MSASGPELYLAYNPAVLKDDPDDIYEKHACLERYLFCLMNRTSSDYVPEGVRLIYSFRVASGGLLFAYTIYLMTGLIIKYRGANPVDRLTLAITTFYWAEIATKFFRDFIAFGLIPNTEFSLLLYIPSMLGRIARICQLCSFVVL